MLGVQKKCRLLLQLKKCHDWFAGTRLFQSANNDTFRRSLVSNSSRKRKMDTKKEKREILFKSILLDQLKTNLDFKSTLYHCNRNLLLVTCKPSLEALEESTSLKSQEQFSTFGTHSLEIGTSDNAQLLANVELSSDYLDCEIDIFDQPKSRLKVFYDKVATVLGSSNYILSKPSFIFTKNYLWQCKYVVQWPTQLSFSSSGFSKKEASQNTARSVLKWLQNQTCMDSQGKPPIHSLLKNNGLSFGNQFRSYTTASQAHSKTDEDAAIPNINPKSILHNYFASVGSELNRKDLKIEPQYQLVKHDKKTAWMCTYILKWPELMKFSMMAASKQEAGTKAAEAALFWLKENNKLTKLGKPLIYDKTEVRNLTKASYPCISFNGVTEERLHSIVDLYEQRFVPEIRKDFANENDKADLQITSEEYEGKWPETSYSNRIQKVEPVNFYMAREPVELPISKYRNDIIEMLNKDRVLIIKGEPGCGKSTRVPQYVLEAWAKSTDVLNKPCRIIVTQPRRIAAISLAERVADEREEGVGSTVGYHVRLDSNFNRHTGRIMYCTTGILLRRLQNDPKLLDCSHVILDEAHERDVNIDLLMNLLKHALILNPSLKLLVMSATLETKTFQDYFNNANVIHIPGFTYSVEQRFLNAKSNNVDLVKTYQMCQGENPNVVFEDVAKVINFIHTKRPPGAILCFLPGWDDITKVMNLLPQTNDMAVLCLHSKLQVSEQRKIFRKPPPGVRKVILSTNIAETSVTINDVVYVVDTGIHKEERFNADKGVSCIDNYWISQASAIQRGGRAGRCQAGECFHLYPENKFKQFTEYSIPEILRTSLTKIVLDSKVYSNNMNAEQFLEQLICPPEKSAIEGAVEELKELELLDENENLTPLGRKISDFQLSPKLSKAMVNSVIFKCVTPVVDIVTLFSSDSSLFTKTLVDKEGIRGAKSRFSNSSDHIAMMNLYEKWLDYVENEGISEASTFCERTGMVHHKLATLTKLREIHTNYLRDGLSSALPISDDLSDNNELIKAVILSGVGTVLQHGNWHILKDRLKKANVFRTRHNQKATITSESVNSRRSKFPSDFFLYINEVVSNLRHTTLVRETSMISPLAVLLFKTGELEIETLMETNFSDKIPSTDQVLLKLKNSKIIFICDRNDALALKRCKEALWSGVQYYINQLTKERDFSQDLNNHWQTILHYLNDILVDNEV